MDPGDPLVGQVVAGRYRLGPLIGQGGMAEVRRAEDVRLGRPVALKFLDPALANRAELRRRFEEEARSAARLNHPSVVQVFDSGEWEGRPFLVMELLSGKTLAAELARGPLPVERVRQVASDVLGALAAAHAAGIVHRDIKPANLLLTADGTVKVSDFGIAKADPLLGGTEETGAVTMTGQVLGTPSYISPERLAGHPATAASDVWAVGVVCWEALAGQRAYPEGTAMSVALAVMNTDLPPIATVRGDVDAWLAEAVDGALRRDPAGRWPSAADMREVLLTGHTALPIMAPTAVAASPTMAVPVMTRDEEVVAAPLAPRWSGRTAMLALVALLLLAAVAALATLLIRGTGSSTTGATTTTAPTTTVPPTTVTVPTTITPTTT
ncbi:MAG TPA: serine/threonine-protein kinase, partial [Acidimicrobiales bacterium]